MVTIIAIACIFGCIIIIFFGVAVLKDTKKMNIKKDDTDDAFQTPDL